MKNENFDAVCLRLWEFVWVNVWDNLKAKLQKHSRGCIYGLSEIWDEIIEELFRFQDKDDSNILNIKDLISLF